MTNADWVLDREWVLARDTHPLSARRAEATKRAFEDLEAPSNHLRLALGVAAGALLMAGTFVASSLGGTSDGANSAAPVPAHRVASLEQRLVVSNPPADAPAPTPAPADEQPRQETPPPSHEPPRTEPATTQPQAGAGGKHDPVAGGGGNQRTTPGTTTPVPAPAPSQQWGSGGQWGYGGQWGSGSQWGYGGQWGSGSQWGYGGQWGSGSQYGSQWGSQYGGQWGSQYGSQWGSGSQWGYGSQQWQPVSGFGAPTAASYAAATSTQSGPAMSMVNPYCPR